eukprot:TRINITY_DN21734_c0_g1_i7.p2 TRINITY_DN21734_c0_g1~~TRINITY_DN21734_c0_g1_i7.p2  ORF type:complete len:173 (-),score=16.25 TRINITY_DN21734_c0_g1_i7:65-583(-)
MFGQEREITVGGWDKEEDDQDGISDFLDYIKDTGVPRIPAPARTRLDITPPPFVAPFLEPFPDCPRRVNLPNRTRPPAVLDRLEACRRVTPPRQSGGCSPGPSPLNRLEVRRSVTPRKSGQRAPVPAPLDLSLIHISEPTRLLSISYAVFCLKKKKKIKKLKYKSLHCKLTK